MSDHTGLKSIDLSQECSVFLSLSRGEKNHQKQPGTAGHPG